MLSLLLLVVAVAFFVWLLGLITFLQPFKQILFAIGILIIVVAVLQQLFGVDVLGAMRHAFH